MSDGFHQVDRRTAMRWAGLLAGALGVAGSAPVIAQGAVAPKGYGTDPKLIGGMAAPWPRTLTAEQLKAITAICDWLLPAEGDAPAASAIGVHELIDEWVSAPYPDQQADRTTILAGLDDLDLRARAAGARSFAAAEPAVRQALLEALAPTTFTRKIRQLIIGGYYTTEAGFKDIGYIGNQALEAYPPASDEVRAHIDAACRRMNLPTES